MTLIPTSVFQLGRMRHLDLLALLCELRPNDFAPPGGLTMLAGQPQLSCTKEQLVAIIMAEEARHARWASSAP